jgi:hypothetical protein
MQMKKVVMIAERPRYRWARTLEDGSYVLIKAKINCEKSKVGGVRC